METVALGTRLAALSLAASLTACTTTSFAPPHVDRQYASTGGRGSGQCEFDRGTIPIQENVQGGLVLIDNFLHVYRCAARESANGRQYFEVPSLLTAAGTAIAAAYGAGPDVAIAGGSAAGLFSAGSNYYAPKDKAQIYQRSLDAINCVNREAAGLPSLAPLVDKARSAGSSDAGPSIVIGAEQQYFRMVWGALVQVEAITTHRLHGLGAFDAAGLMAEIKAVEQRVKDAEAERGQPPAGQPPGDATRGGALGGAISDRAIRLDLQVMQPKLDECVVRAKV